MTVKEAVAKDPGSLIARAYVFAAKAHAGQKRKSGESFINHPLATAETLAAWRLDESSIAAGLLHDVVEDTPTTRESLVKNFGEEVAFLVDGVTKLSHIKYRGAEEKIENLRKMILAVSQDLRVVFVKLADRLHNMKTLDALPREKQKRIALETSEIYAPIANRLGMHELAGEFQDLAFSHLHPQEAKWLTGQVKDEYGVRRKYLESFAPDLERVLKAANITPTKIDFRAKHYYSLYKKLFRYDMDISRIYDLVALRVIFKTVPECYAALGVVHEHWPPFPGRIKDYIAMPKINNYRSLHTTIIGPEGKHIEIQLRTEEMHAENEYGIAAHWLYKEKQTNKTRVDDVMAWVRQIKNWQEEHTSAADNPEDFLRTMKIEFFKDRIFVITPHGDVIDLPAGSTPVDFAYHIHSEIGASCVAAKVNGQFAPLDHELQSGDLVEILTQKNKRPSEDWLKFVKTSMARDHVRLAMKQKDQALRTKRLPTKVEIRIVARYRVGLLKDITAIIARSHFNIVSANKAAGQFPIIRIQCDTADKKKVEALVLKLKKMKETKEVGYQLI